MKVGDILPQFKGKRAKANNKDNYRDITLFPTLCKIYELILLNRLEKYAAQMGLFQKDNLVFKREWVAMKHPSLFLRQLITCWSVVAKFSAVFSMFAKPLTQSGLTVFLYKLLSELGIRGRIWLASRDLYTNVKAQAFYEGSLFRKIKLTQGTGQRRILATFMYKVYMNGLLNVLSNHFYAVFINGLRIPSSSFANDISLLTLHPSFLKTFMNICNRYGIRWRYDFNHSKSGIVTFGESLKNCE